MQNVPFISKQVTSGEYYFLNLRPEKGTAGTVVCGGKEHCDPAYNLARNRFRFHSIEYVTDGLGELTLGSAHFSLRPGMAFYYSPTTPHVIATDPRRPLVKYFIDFCGPRFTRLLASHPLSDHHPCFLGPTSGVAELYDRLQTSGRSSGPRTHDICACLLELLILLIADHALSEADAESPAQNTYRRCRELIERRFLDLHSLDGVARACHINAPYLCRLFKRYGAESPYHMLIRLKMRQAGDLLSGPQPLVKQVAKATGFADPYHFSRVFKKIYGISPRTFLQSTRRPPLLPRSATVPAEVSHLTPSKV